MMDTKYVVWAALAGGLIPVMCVVNARLGVTLGNPLQAPVVLLLIALAQLGCWSIPYDATA